MTLSYNFGLTAGSLMAYFLETVLPPINEHPCGPNPIDIKLPYALQNSTFSTVSTLFTSTISMDTTMINSLTSTSSNVLDATFNTTFDMG